MSVVVRMSVFPLLQSALSYDTDAHAWLEGSNILCVRKGCFRVSSCGVLFSTDYDIVPVSAEDIAALISTVPSAYNRMGEIAWSKRKEINYRPEVAQKSKGCAKQILSRQGINAPDVPVKLKGSDMELVFADSEWYQVSKAPNYSGIGGAAFGWTVSYDPSAKKLYMSSSKLIACVTRLLDVVGDMTTKGKKFIHAARMCSYGNLCQTDG